MGGILGGLIGGLIKGSTGGLTAEGERIRKEENYQKNLLTQMHINALSDWENLSPQAQEGHVKSLENIWGDKKGIFRSGINLVHSIRPHLQPPADPVTGKPAPYLDDPLGEIAQQSGIGGPETRTPNQEKVLQAALIRQRQEDIARKAESQQKEADIQANVAAVKDKPNIDLSEYEAALRNPAYARLQNQGTFSKEGNYIDENDVHHNVKMNNKTGKLLDVASGQEFTQLPANWTPLQREPYPGTLGDYIARLEKDKKSPLTPPETIQARKNWMSAIPPTYQYFTNLSGEIAARASSRGGPITPVPVAPGAEGARRGMMPSSESDARSNIQTMEAFANQLNTLGTKLESKLGGPFGAKGKWQKYIMEPAGMADADMTSLINTAEQAKTVYTYMVSGKQTSAAEMARLSTVLPDPSGPLPRFKSNLQRMNQILTIMKNVRAMGKAGADEADFAAYDKQFGSSGAYGARSAKPSLSAPPQGGGPTLKSGNKIKSITIE